MSDTTSPQNEMTRPRRIGIVAWQALPAVQPMVGRNVGGLETAAWLLARALARHESVECSFFVRHHVSITDSHIDSVDIKVDVDPREFVRREVSSYFATGPIHAIKRIRPSIVGKILYLAVSRPWRRADPEPRTPDPRLLGQQLDAWIAMGVSRESAGVIATAKRQHKKSLVMIQSNADLDSRYASDPKFRNRYGELGEDCLFAIQQCDHVVCQTDHQLRLLRDGFGLDGVLIRNAIDLDRWSDLSNGRGSHVLWIGRYDDFHKRPHLAMEIAAKCPEISFRMIINPSDARIESELNSRCPPNVTIDSYIPNDAMPKTMADCRVFLSTGAAEYEGFPNVLLQAAAAGKPIVSLDDFDSFLQRSGAGVHTDGNIDAAADSIRELYAGKRTIDHQQTREYLRQHHDVGSIVSRLLKLLDG